jgi:hypothetical protein
MVLPVNAYAVSRKTNKEMQKVADPILDNILEAFKLEDYIAYSKDFDKTLKIVGSRTKFFKVARFLQDSIGNYLYREYMGSIYKQDSIVVLWKGSFDKTREDVLIKLFLSKKNNRYVVTGLRFQ